MSGNKPILSAKSDFIFKLIFGDQRNVDLLASLLSSVLNIPQSEYDRITIIDPHVKKESIEDKYGILDVKLTTKSGFVLHVEIQVEEIPEMVQRTVFYQSKMITEQIGAGQSWDVIQKTISIIITDFPLVPQNNKYHNQFRYRAEDGTQFTDLTEINTLELKKLPTVTDNSELWDWLEFIQTDDEEVLNMLQERSEQMRKAVGVLKQLSADEQTRMLYEQREIARRDEVSRVRGAWSAGWSAGRNEGAAVIIRKMLNRGKTVEEIMEYTGLPRIEVENSCHD